ncbi:reverse transcriptase domain-containing protein [Tanacetum coccineum]
MAEGEIDNLTMEQYIALTRGNQAPGVVKPEIVGNVNFKIKSQFMRELREDTFSENKNDDAHEHVERVLDIVSLFNIPGVSHDAFMLRVFPITLTRAAKRWLEEIRNFKQEGDETLDQAWERYNDLLYRCPTHDINSHQKTMADHSQKWHDGSSSRNIDSSSNSEGIAAIVNKLDSLGRDMKKLKEKVHTIQVGCQTCGGAHLDKECPLNEEVKSVEEARLDTTHALTIAHHLEKKRPSLEELMNKHLEESTRRRSEMEEWVKKLQENAEINTRNQIASLKNLENQIKQLTKEFHAKTTSEVNNSSFDQCKAVYADKEAQLNNKINKPHEVSFVQEEGASINVIPKFTFEHLKLARLKKTDMLVEMTDITKRAPIGLVENILVKIDKFLFPLDFVVIDMLNMRNETMILRVTFDMNKKIHNFMTLVGKIYMINLIHNDESPSYSNASSDKSSRMNEEEVLRLWYCYLDGDRENIKGSEELVKDPRSRSFDDYKWMFDLEINQLADEYELGIGKKEHMLDDIWENCKKVQGDNTYWWCDQKSEEEERREIRVDIEGIDGCFTIGKRNGSRFREMIRKEVDSGGKVHRKTLGSEQWKEGPQKDVVSFSNCKGMGISRLLDSCQVVNGSDVWRNHLGYAVTDVFTA